MTTITMIASIVHCYVGCGAGSDDLQALHVLECDTESGAARIVQSVKGPQGSTYLALDAARRYLYTMNREDKLSALVRYPFEGWRLGKAERLAKIPCEAPCHISLTPDESRVAFAAYSSATAGTCPIAGGASTVFVFPDDAMGPNPKRQQKAYAHCTFYTPDGKWLGIVDLGCDRIWFFDPVTMARNESLVASFDPGDGPRHAIWSKDNRFLFVLNELGSSITTFAYDGRSLAKVGKWTMLPPGVPQDASKASAIKLTADGKLLMGSNRGYDSIAFFDVDAATGCLALRNIAKVPGSFPRDFELMPGERFMVVGHERSNNIQICRFDRAVCTLEPVGEPIAACKPICFKFLEEQQ